MGPASQDPDVGQQEAQSQQGVTSILPKRASCMGEEDPGQGPLGLGLE